MTDYLKESINRLHEVLTTENEFKPKSTAERFPVAASLLIEICEHTFSLESKVEQMEQALRDVYNNRFDHNKIQDIVELMPNTGNGMNKDKLLEAISKEKAVNEAAKERAGFGTLYWEFHEGSVTILEWLEKEINSGKFYDWTKSRDDSLATLKKHKTEVKKHGL